MRDPFGPSGATLALTSGVLIGALLAAPACKGRDKSEQRQAMSTEASPWTSAPSGGASNATAAAPAAPAMEMSEKMADKPSDEKMRDQSKEEEAAGEDGRAEGNFGAGLGGKKGNRGGGGGEAATRAWFPETFLFEPRIVTDAEGAATVEARVPDRLTSWRVLALAHSRSGAQGGAVASFLGTLPTYVDPVVPKVLVVGDEVRVPIQIVNTTSAAVSARLTVEAANATVTSPSAQITLGASGSRVEYARLVATRAGKAALKVTLGDTDAVVRTIDVVSPGRPVVITRSGTLAAPRTLTIAGTPGADPAADRVRLLAYPGALALLRSELGAASSRTGTADDAYALLLAGRATKLLEALGEKADPDAVRELGILAGQRAIRDARTFDVSSAALLAEAALSHPQNPVMQRLGARAAEYLSRNQRPDGTFSGDTGWTVQRVLVATADATRAVASATSTPEELKRATAALVRAAGAFERNAVHIEDGYTAAAVLASGALAGGDARAKLREELRAKVRAAIVPAGGEDGATGGAKVLGVGEGVVRADGTVPSTMEATALAVLALEGDAQAPLADLGASLLGGYGFDRGWGDGYTNLLALRAVLELFDNPLPDQVKIQLLMDGALVTEGVLTKDKLREVLALEAAVPAPGLAGAHQWKIVAEPAVPGLGFSLALQSWVPWEKEQASGGVELQLPERVSGSVGAPISLELSAVAPAGLALHVRHALPAEVSADRASLQALVDDGTLARFELADGRADLYAGPLPPGKVLTVKYRAVATLAGTLHATASLFEAGGQTFHVPPTTWVIK
jgi:Alpha-2-macroglobulin family